MNVSGRSHRQKKKGTPPKWGDVAASLPGGSALMRRVREQKILDSWNDAVGSGIAEQTRPVRVRNQILEINVSSSVWMQQLQFMKGLILQKLRERGTPLQDLRFFIGEIGSGSGEAAEKKLAIGLNELSSEERARISREVASIADPETREILSRIYAQSLWADRTRKR